MPWPGYSHACPDAPPPAAFCSLWGQPGPLCPPIYRPLTPLPPYSCTFTVYPVSPGSLLLSLFLFLVLPAAVPSERWCLQARPCVVLIRPEMRGRLGRGTRAVPGIGVRPGAVSPSCLWSLGPLGSSWASVSLSPGVGGDASEGNDLRDPPPV